MSNSSANLLKFFSLLALMLLTRAHHIGSALHLPGASAAVFFLGGFYLSGRGLSGPAAGALLGSAGGADKGGRASRFRPSAFWLFLGAAVTLDFSLFFAGRTSGFCLTPGYAFLLPAYAILWQGGRLLAQSQKSGMAFLFQGAVCWFAVSAVSYLIRNASFYWLSGRYPDANMAQYLDRLAQYFVPFVTTPTVYLVAALALHVVLVRSQRRVAYS